MASLTFSFIGIFPVSGAAENSGRFRDPPSRNDGGRLAFVVVGLFAGKRRQLAPKFGPSSFGLLPSLLRAGRFGEHLDLGADRLLADVDVVVAVKFGVFSELGQLPGEQGSLSISFLLFGLFPFGVFEQADLSSS